MNGFSDSLSTNMENSRNCLRRIARHDDQEFSNQSILNAMEKFVKTVNSMDETILVPCRLMDHKVGDISDTVCDSSKKSKKKNDIRDTLSSTDLFNLYTMLNGVKVDLLWGRNAADRTSEEEACEGATLTVKGHVRRPSTASLNSTNSVVSISDSESETGNENDSGIEAEEPSEPKDNSLVVAENFRRHLLGLYRSLEQMTEAANYLTARYQNDVGGSV